MLSDCDPSCPQPLKKVSVELQVTCSEKELDYVKADLDARLSRLAEKEKELVIK